MPRLGSQLRDFIISGLIEKKYINLQWHTIKGIAYAFSLEHVHQMNKNFCPEYFNIYKDYYALKKPGIRMPSLTIMKSMLDSALRRKGSKYIRYLKKQGKKYLYEINSSSSGFDVSSPASSFSTSDDEQFRNGDMDLKSDVVSRTILISPKNEMNAMHLTLSPEIFDENLFDCSTGYINSAIPIQVSEFEKLTDVKEMDMLPDFESTIKYESLGTDIQQDILEQLPVENLEKTDVFFGDMAGLECETQANEQYFENADIGLGSLCNDSLSSFNNSIFSSNALFQNEISNEENQLIPGTNGSNKDNAVISVPVVKESVSGDVYASGMIPELTAEDFGHHNYCERSLEVKKIGNEYTFIFKTVSNTLPLNDEVFLYLSRICSPANSPMLPYTDSS